MWLTHEARPWRRLGARAAWLVCGWMLAGFGLFAQERPSVSVRLARSDDTPSVYVSVSNLLADDGFVRAMRSGFPLYVEYEVELRQTRANWFDRGVTTISWEYVAWYDPVRERFVLEDASQREEVGDESALRERLRQVYFMEALEPDQGGAFYYRARVTARTLSDEDVDEVFRWLRGEDGRSVQRPGIVTRAARRLLVQLAPLPRVTLEGRSAVFLRR